MPLKFIDDEDLVCVQTHNYIVWPIFVTILDKIMQIALPCHMLQYIAPFVMPISFLCCHG